MEEGVNLTDYQKMYTTLFNAVTEAIKLLQWAQSEAEDIYISGDEAEDEEK